LLSILLLLVAVVVLITEAQVAVEQVDIVRHRRVKIQAVAVLPKLN
jgi:hypothetical protein